MRIFPSQRFAVSLLSIAISGLLSGAAVAAPAPKALEQIPNGKDGVKWQEVQAGKLAEEEQKGRGEQVIRYEDSNTGQNGGDLVTNIRLGNDRKTGVAVVAGNNPALDTTIVVDMGEKHRNQWFVDAMGLPRRVAQDRQERPPHRPGEGHPERGCEGLPGRLGSGHLGQGVSLLVTERFA
ncbi:hypothetical protein [Azotobacter beijerinckii]|uniref:hypothetical protein n=1 Tax=Azotobacter beijerinckii TaxID=170623 RepID=UPI000ACC7FF2|nr:hypothetical protein [Azotobacter beijerinckii]